MKITTLAILSAFAIAQETDKPPSITYGSSRESKAWIEKPDGVSVAVDDGITWKGVTVYLSLTSDLVAVDEKTKKTLWAKSVGAFWNRVTFVETSRAGGKSWAVELRPGPRETEGKDLRQLHDLRTGEIFASAEDRPAGAKIELKRVKSGSQSRIAKGFRAVVSTKENWDKLRGRMFGEPADLRSDVEPDFTKEILLVVSGGDSWNCRGLGVESAYLVEKSLLFRLTHETYQTIGDGVRDRPFGIFVLPRKDCETVQFQRNVQPYIGGPPIWKDDGKLERPKDPAKELDSVPEPDPLKKD